MKQPSILAGRSTKSAPPERERPLDVMHAAQAHSPQRSPAHAQMLRVWALEQRGPRARCWAQRTVCLCSVSCSCGRVHDDAEHVCDACKALPQLDSQVVAQLPGSSSPA